MLYALIAIGELCDSTLLSYHADGEHDPKVVFCKYDMWHVGIEWSPELDDLPAGLYAWTGTARRQTDEEAAIEPADFVYEGTTRKATVVEAQRFALGLPVFGVPADAVPEPKREALGRTVREVWERWARQQPNPKVSWLTPWKELTEPEREVDRRIGEAIFRLYSPVDCGAAVAYVNNHFQGCFHAGEEPATVLVRLLGELNERRNNNLDQSMYNALIYAADTAVQDADVIQDLEGGDLDRECEEGREWAVDARKLAREFAEARNLKQFSEESFVKPVARCDYKDPKSMLDEPCGKFVLKEGDRCERHPYQQNPEAERGGSPYVQQRSLLGRE